MRSLRTQIFFIIMIIIIVTVLIISIFSNILINKKFDEYIVLQQQQKVADIVSNINHQYNSLTGKWNTEYIHGVGMYAMYEGFVIKVYDSNKTAVWDAENHNMAMCRDIMKEIENRMNDRRPELYGEFVSYEYDLTLAGQTIGSINISYYSPYFLSETDFKFLDTLNIAFVIIIIVALFVSFIISGILAQRIVRPISKTAYISNQISKGDYSIRFEGKTKLIELDELSTAINSLASGLSEQESLRKRLTVDIAHELRTPLTTVGSHLEAMIEGIWDPTKQRLQSCYEETQRLSGLITDLERLSEIESDDFVLNKTNVDMMEIVMSCINVFEAEMKKKNLSVEIEGNSSLVCVDRDKIVQVITNLISNAVKYTLENGNIYIEVIDKPSESTIVIKDDGIGIPEHELPLVFERFYRTDKSRSRKTGGAGIGLAIVKSIVTAHGGSVEAQKTNGRGSKFVVTFVK